MSNSEIYSNQLSIFLLLSLILNQKGSAEENWSCLENSFFLSVTSDWASFSILHVESCAYFVRSWTTEVFKFDCVYKFIAELQLNFRSNVVLAHQVLSCLVSVKYTEPIYWDKRNKIYQKCLRWNVMKLFYERLNSRCSCIKDMVHRNCSYYLDKFQFPSIPTLDVGEKCNSFS